ncbi:hypothetical protein Hanom_Chr12g01095151 [Helianthus anomalus]
MIVEQFGFATNAPFPNLTSFIASPLTSGITNGTPSTIRNAELLSTTTVPHSTATGPNSLLIDPPALNRAISTPLKLSPVNSSTTYSFSSNVYFFPADRLLASILIDRYGNERSERTDKNSWPTAPVTPTTAIDGPSSRSAIRTVVGRERREVGFGWWRRVGVGVVPVRKRRERVAGDCILTEKMIGELKS